MVLRSHRGRMAVALAVAVLATLLPGGAGAQDAAGEGAGGPQLRTLSARADLVSGGDARIAVLLPAGASADGLTVTVDGRDVTAAFAPDGEGRLVGVVAGLAAGQNVVVARLGSGAGARLTLTNHDVGGPLFAGPQVQPWACTTEANGLGPPTDPEDCSAPAVFRYVYRDAVTGSFRDYDPEAPPPDALVATTTTDEGRTVPYVVRIERGTLDRSVYDVAVLHDPHAEDGGLSAWNDKLVYRFGGSCSARHSQTPPGANSQAPPGSNDGYDDGGVLTDQPLRLGFAVASTGLNTLGQNCNPTVSAEAVALLSEHVGDAYGEVRYTIGQGCSGGSIQQTSIAARYPGLLDGLLPRCSFSDLWSPITEVAECALLQHYFTQTAPALWPDPLARRAVEGSATGTTCAGWVATFAPALDPSTALPPTGCDVPADQRYDAEANPGGVRCTVQDYNVAIWGRRADDGFANRPLDNVGVQYGLRALADGAISAEQFVDLNASVGGLDIDGQPAPERMRADPGAVTTLHRSGELVSGHALAGVPIIDQRGSSNAEVHTDYWSWSTRARLEAANANAGNHVIWTNGGSLPGDPVSDALAFVTIDAWLAAIEADGSDRPLADTVVANRPDVAQDACFAAGQMVTDLGACASAFPYFGSPRTAAGGPLASDVLQCGLAPLDRAAYPAAFSDEQWARLQEAFPEGVCDWEAAAPDAEPGLTWPAFSGGPRGAALGPAPASVPLAPGPQVQRVAGEDRIATAAAVSAATRSSAATVVVARADEPADALAGGPLAAALDAPLLLAHGDALPAATLAEIGRLGTRHAVVLGGEAALGPEVAGALATAGLSVRRVAGPDRFATAAAVAEDLGHRDQVILARGDGTFADALAGGALGAAAGAPVLLLRGGDVHAGSGQAGVPAATAAALEGRTSAIVLGGAAAVSDATLAEVAALVPTVERLGGADRYDTAALAATRALEHGATTDSVWVATGATFPDALAVGAAAHRSPLLLVGGPGAGTAEARAWLQANPAARLRLAGGTAAVSPDVATELAAVLT